MTPKPFTLGRERPRYYGKFMAICRDNNDPSMAGRIRVEAPYPLGAGVEAWSNWALPCLPANSFDVPEEGDGVWVEFMNGELTFPIWVGIWHKGQGADTSAPFQAVHAAMLDMDGNEADPDKTDHAVAGSADDDEHKEFHDHATGFYTPHRRGYQSPTGHTLEFNDHPGREAAVALTDRFGRTLQLLAEGYLKLRSYVVTAGSTDWLDLDGDPADASHSLTFADFFNDDVGADAGQWLRLKDMAGAFLQFTSTPGDEQILLEDYWGQHFKIRTAEGEEAIEILDKSGQKVTLDAVAGTVKVEQPNGNFVLMQDGSIVINVPSTSDTVFIGGDGSAKRLATEDFVTGIYNTHTHPTPAGPSGPPVLLGTETTWPNVTRKGKSE